jgi:hypothetical protein
MNQPVYRCIRATAGAARHRARLFLVGTASRIASTTRKKHFLTGYSSNPVTTNKTTSIVDQPQQPPALDAFAPHCRSRES